MKKWILGVALPMAAMVGAAGLAGCATSSNDVEVSGSAWFRERIMLPPTATLQVQLLDVSRMDVAANVLDEVSMPAGAGPQAFSLTLSRDELKPGHTYAVGARITEGDTLLFINTQSYRVDLNQPTGMSVMLEQVGR